MDLKGLALCNFSDWRCPWVHLVVVSLLLCFAFA